MNIRKEIEHYLESQQEPKRSEMDFLHKRIIALAPESRLWYLDGKDSNNKTVSNPNIGYGIQTLKYAGGRTREFYQIGLSANTSGISVYIMGLSDKDHLKKNFGSRIGKATVTGYCIKFKTLKDIALPVLEEAILLGLQQNNS